MGNNRPYKEASPKQTISRIFNILKKIDLLVIPKNYANPVKGVYSFRVESVKEDGYFGANGKGGTETYALASAYAEIIERVQNQFISGASGFNIQLSKLIKDVCGFYYYPDEQYLNRNSFSSLPKNVLYDLFSTDSKDELDEFITRLYSFDQVLNAEGVAAVPFYSYKDKKPILLPANILVSVTGSNGMAAGNTIPEAVFQGLCEVFERYAATIIYYERLTPPTIEIQNLKEFPDELSVISEIEKSGYQVAIKDFSCGIGLPVIGLIIKDKNAKKYRLNLASDTNLKIALNRTLNEIYQGVTDDENFKEHYLLPFPNEDVTPYFFDSKLDENLHLNLKYFKKNGSGIFPPELFQNYISYKTDLSVFNPKPSYEEDIKHLVGITKVLGLDLYIRDVSFLGFPSVHIYVPNVSTLTKAFNIEHDKKISNYFMLEEFVKIVFPFEEFIRDKERIKKAISIIENVIKFEERIELYELFHLKLKKGSTWDVLSYDFFLVILYFLINEFEKAAVNLSCFMKENHLENNNYYKEAISFLSKLKLGDTIENVSIEVRNDFKDEKSLFDDIGYPNCPQCSKCKLRNDCLTSIHIEKLIKINKKFSETDINQNKFAIFS